ncbi:creatininase family protein [Candidatus Nitrosotalea bavarica]|uniref:creatininase family protein n=1 Tax=Candidatus Nitrosotalea bavarica TaxID=1903277 RepID=UPI000C706F83|nr:creatininase family protein [Candidatus Nitrosotalea bavarica]
MIVRDLTNTDILKLTKRKIVALIPVGSIEQHGPHLPVSTDSDIVSHIAKQVSDKNGFLLLPTLQYGVSFEHHPFFNMSISTSTLQKILIELCISLSKNHINTVIILNGHHGNQDALKKLQNKVFKKTGIRQHIFVYSYWHFMKRKFDHAGFVETSIMLAISDKVLMNKAKKGLIPDNLSKKKLNLLNKRANKSFISVTKNGIWGDPTKATIKDGKIILGEIIANIVKKSQTCLTGTG